MKQMKNNGNEINMIKKAIKEMIKGAIKKSIGRIISRRLPAMMTLEAVYVVPMFFLILFGGISVGVNMYMNICVEAEDIQDNKDIDAVKNFRYASLGKNVISALGGDK